MTLIFLATKVIVNTGDSHGLRRTTSSKSSYKIQLDRIENSNKRLSPANEMHFFIRQRVVSTNVHLLRIDDSIPTAQLSMFTTRIYSGVLDNPHTSCDLISAYLLTDFGFALFSFVNSLAFASNILLADMNSVSCKMFMFRLSGVQVRWG